MANEIEKKETRELTMEQHIGNITKSVINDLDKKKSSGLMVPQDYAPMNALTSAMFILSRTSDKSGKSVLATCTPNSIKEALLDMVLSGTNPAKKQCYFIAYGNKLTYMDSYFGVQMKAKKADPNIKALNATVVYNKDEFSYVMGDATIVDIIHKQKPENVDIDQIKGAYATIIYEDGTRMSEYMTMKQISNSWSKGTTKGLSEAHKLAPEEMCKRTVLKRLAKATINSSTDADIMYDNEHFLETEEIYEEQEATDVICIEEETIEKEDTDPVSVTSTSAAQDVFDLA